MDDFTKIICPGTISGYAINPTSIFCKIKYVGGKLSITGVIGPKSNGDAWGDCGQIDSTLRDNIDSIELGTHWTAKTFNDFLDVWEKWHLNDMRAGCQHQRELGWDKLPIDPTKPLDSYGKFFPGQEFASWNMLTWVTRKEHPAGLLLQPCPVCGYKYGTSWLTEAVPVEVLVFLKSLPDSPIQPFWC